MGKSPSAALMESKNKKAPAKKAAAKKEPAKKVRKDKAPAKAKEKPKAKEQPAAQAKTEDAVASGKVKAAAKVKGKIDPNDLINSTAAQIEKLDKDTAFNRVPELINSVDHNYFQLGGVLSVILSKDWATEAGFESFRDLIEQKFGIQYRKAMYLIDIYRNLVEAEVPFEKVAGIGWSKLKELASILTPDNVDEWVQKAMEHTTLQLAELVKKFKAGKLEKSDTTPDTGGKGPTTFTVKVHEDQKETIQNAIEKAKKEADTPYPGVALEAICMGYMAGAGKASKPLPLKQVLAKYTYEDVLAAFGEVWPNIDLTATVQE